MRPRINIKYGLFCDDVRREDNGKVFIIGLYVAPVIVENFPLSMSIKAYIVGMPTQTGRIPFRVKVKYMPDDYSVHEMGATAVFNELEPDETGFDLAFGMQAPITKAGYLSLQFSQHAEEAEEISRLRIKKATASSATASPPPS